MTTNLPQLNLNEGGKIVVLGGSPSRNWPSFITHPQLDFWDADKGRQLKEKQLPSNTKAVLFSRFLGHNLYEVVVRQARKRNIAVYGPLGTNTIAEILFNATKEVKLIKKKEEEQVFVLPEKKSVSAIVQAETNKLDNKGLLPLSKEILAMATTNKTGNPSKLHVLIPHIVTTIPASDNARALLIKAKEMGVETTEMSLINFVRVWAKKQGVNLPHGKRGGMFKGIKRGPYKKTQPKKVNDDAIVGIIDNMINEMKDLKDYISKTNKENKSLRKQMEKFAKVAKFFK